MNNRYENTSQTSGKDQDKGSGYMKNIEKGVEGGSILQCIIWEYGRRKIKNWICDSTEG